MGKIIQFLASKWFVLTLLILMGLALPTTYHNFKVVWDADVLSQFWYIGLVFACNVLAVFMAFWKYMNLITTKKDKVDQW